MFPTCLIRFSLSRMSKYLVAVALDILSSFWMSLFVTCPALESLDPRGEELVEGFVFASKSVITLSNFLRFRS